MRAAPVLALGLLLGAAAGFAAGWAFRDDPLSAPGAPPSVAHDGPGVAPSAGGGSRRDAATPSAMPSATTSSRSSGATPRETGAAKPSRVRAADPVPGAAAGGDPSTIVDASRGVRAAAPRADAPAAAPDVGATEAAVPDASRASDSVADPAPRVVTGVVIDGTTQAPLAGARVLYAAVGGDHAGGWWGDTTDAEGRFRHDVRDDAVRAAELRVSMDGYEPRAVRPVAEPMRIELRPRPRGLLPGRVVGVARGPGGAPLHGEIVVLGIDEGDGNVAQTTTAAADGAYVLEGVPAGRWRMSVAPGAWVAVVVPEAGDARLDLSSAAPRGGAGTVVTDVDPSAVKPDDPEAARKLEALLRLAGDVARDPAIDDATRERVALALYREVQRLQEAADAARPRRDVTVTGVATSGRAWLRMESKPRSFRRVETRSGAARFASLPIGVWTAVLVEPGRPDRTAQIVVPAGAEPLEIAFAAE